MTHPWTPGVENWPELEESAYARMNPTAMKQFLLGIDIGGTKCAVALATANAEIVAREAVATRPEEREPEAVIRELTSLARALCEKHGAARDSILGVGISCGGPLDRDSGTILGPPNLPGWKAVPVRQLVETALCLPVALDNDANATAVAEHRFGAAVGCSNVVFCTMGTGIGGGLILDGRLYHGASDLAGELGHQTILPDGPLCRCGKRGCLEALASGPAIARAARESLAPGRDKRVRVLAGGSVKAITAMHVVEAAKQGDRFALDILTEAGYFMGIGLANIVQILNPEIIVLGTLAVHAGDLILEPIRQSVAEHAWPRSREACRIVPAALGDRAQDLAAIALLLQ